MNRAVLLFLFSTFTLFADEQWPGVPFAEVRAYYYQVNGGEEPIIKDGKLHSSVVNKEGALLNATQTKRLIEARSLKVLYRRYKCYSPRHGFVFYDRDKKPVAYIEVCLECIGSDTKPSRKGYLDFPTVLDLIEELELPFGPQAGNAKAIRLELQKMRFEFDEPVK